MLMDNPRGQYRFLTGIDAFSSGIVAGAGHEVIHATLRTPLPWRAGFDLIDGHMSDSGRNRQSLCAIELRCPSPYDMAGFMAFNEGYCDLCQAWDLYVDGFNPVARTNVAPALGPPSEPMLHAFSYTVPADGDAPLTFVVAGGAELREGSLDEDLIVRRGETTPDAMRDKAAFVAALMGSRLDGLGANWDLVTTIDVYTVHMVEGLLEDAVLESVGTANRHGVSWTRARPPVRGLDYEMDVRGIRCEITV